MSSAPRTASVANDHSGPRSALFASASNRSAIIALLLFLGTLVTYNPISHNDFVKFDDPGYVTANRHVNIGITWKTIAWAFGSTEQANWHPITWLSHALDVSMFGLRPAGHHYVSLLLHAAIGILLFLFLQGATGFTWRSAMVAALFAVHPMNVESVAWLAERKSTLSTLFFVLMLLAYRRYAEYPEWKRYVGVLALFGMSLMSKPMLVTAPFLLLLIDYWPLKRNSKYSWNHLALEKAPLALMSTASCIVTIIAQKSGGAIHHDEFPLAGRVLNAMTAYMRYMGKALWPSHLAAFYPYTENIPGGEVAAAILILGTTTIAVVMQRERKYLTVGWLWFLGTLIPVIGLIQVGEQGMADRYAYVPFIGLFIAVVWEVADWTKRAQIPAKYVVSASCIVLVAFASRTYIQIGYWHDTKTLWTHALGVTGPNFVAEDSLGAELIEENNFAEAVQHLQRAATINPRDPFAWLDLGVCQNKSGNLAAAVADYQAALSLSSERNLRATALGNLGSIYRLQGDYAQAQSNYKSALELLPDYTLALTGMGLIAEKQGSPGVAATYFARAASSTPSDLEYLLLAQALGKAGRQQDEQAALTKAQSLSQDWEATADTVNHLLQE